MPSYGGSHGPDGSKKSGDQGQSSRSGRDGGNRGGAGGGARNPFSGAATHTHAPSEREALAKSAPARRDAAMTRGQRSSSANRPRGMNQVARYSKLNPNGKAPTTSIGGAVTDLAQSIADGDAYGKYGEPDMSPGDITSRNDDPMGGVRGSMGNKVDYWEQMIAPQQQQTTSGGGGTAAPTPMTADQYLNDILQNFINPNTRYYLEQRGLVDPSAPAGIPEEWQPVIDREFNFAKSTLPQDWYDPKAKKEDVFTKLRTYFSDQFGDTALTNEQNRRRNDYTTQLKGKGFEGQLENAFGDTADDSLIESILNPQYQAAQDIITNQQKRGTLTPTGYQYALNRLGEQKTSGLNTLQGIGATQREKLSGGVRDYLSSIYDKAGEYQLGQQFDPNAFDSEFGNRLSSASGSLESSIRGAAPTNLFDTATVQQDAGNVQGQTSRGSLLDTLSSRQRRGSQQRGLGTTGAF